MTATNTINIEVRISEGIYLVKDVSKILNLPYEKVYRWIVGYWGGNLDRDYNYTFGSEKAINFYSLIEFYTFFKLREKGVSTSKIRELHDKLSDALQTPYPFAIAQDFYVDKERKKTKTREFFILHI